MLDKLKNKYFLIGVSAMLINTVCWLFSSLTMGEFSALEFLFSVLLKLSLIALVLFSSNKILYALPVAAIFCSTVIGITKNIVEYGTNFLTIIIYFLTVSIWGCWLAVIVLSAFRLPFDSLLRRLVPFAATACCATYLLYYLIVGFFLVRSMNQYDISNFVAVVSNLAQCIFVWSLGKWLISSWKNNRKTV